MESVRSDLVEVEEPVPGGLVRRARRSSTDGRGWRPAVDMIGGTGIVYRGTTEVRHPVCRLDDAPRCTVRVTTRTG